MKSIPIFGILEPNPNLWEAHRKGIEGHLKQYQIIFWNDKREARAFLGSYLKQAECRDQPMPDLYVMHPDKRVRQLP